VAVAATVDNASEAIGTTVVGLVLLLVVTACGGATPTEDPGNEVAATVDDA
jgi:TRAP-type mannitol/chloroaromatic compound transport system permease small subunit